MIMNHKRAATGFRAQLAAKLRRGASLLDAGGVAIATVPSLLPSLPAEHALAAADLAGIGIWMLDLGAGTAQWSKNCAELLGLGVDAGISYELLLASFRADDRAALEHSLQRCIRLTEREPFQHELRLASPADDRDSNWLECRGRVVSGNNATLLLCTLTNVTSLQRALAKTSAARDRLQAVANLSSLGIILFNELGRIESLNDAARRLFGYTDHEAAGRLIDTLMPAITDLPATPASLLQQQDADLTKDDVANTVGLNRSGSEIQIVARVAEFGEGRQKSFVATFSEKSEVPNLATPTGQLASSSRSAFFSYISHEIRSPLSSVLGFAELLLDDKLSAVQRAQYIGVMQRNCSQLSTLVSDVLDLSRLENGKLAIDSQTVSLSEVLQETLSVLNPRAKEKDMTISVSIDADVPPQFRSDAFRLRQTLLNALGYAIRISPNGAIKLAVRCLPMALRPSTLAFMISDHGPALTAKQQARLFEPFGNGSDEERTDHLTGISLMLARQMARLLGGDMRLSVVEPGIGNTFSVSIDAQPTTEPAKFVADRLPLPVMSSSEPVETRLDGIRLLVVEDLPDNRMLITSILRLAGATVEAVENGALALAPVRDGGYDAVLMDLQMPVMDGFTATAEIRRTGNQIPIIALTAHVLKEERQRCLASGFNDHLGKPVNRAPLLSTLARVSAVPPAH